MAAPGTTEMAAGAGTAKGRLQSQSTATATPEPKEMQTAAVTNDGCSGAQGDASRRRLRYEDEDKLQGERDGILGAR